MNSLLRILGDRGFWTSATTLLTFVLTKAFHMQPDDANLLTGCAAALCMTIDGILASNQPPKGPTA
jgi:hypothetical protein